MKLNPFRRPLSGDRAAVRDVQIALQQLQTKSKTRVAALNNAISTPRAQLTREIADAFAYMHTAGQAIERLQQTLADAPVTDTGIAKNNAYLLSSVFVLELFQYLTTDPHGHERMVYITGPVAPDGTAVLSTMHKIETAKQSAGYVQADPSASAAFLEDLTTNKQHQLWAMFHNHPMTGRQGTRPSATDLAHQDRLVKIGMAHTLGGIFSLDGWVRIFSTARDFDLSLYGASVELIEDRPREKTIRIDQKEISHVAPQSAVLAAE